MYMYIRDAGIGKSLIKDARETKWPPHSMYYALYAYISAKIVSLAFWKAYLPFFIDAEGI